MALSFAYLTSGICGAVLASYWLPVLS